MSVMSADDEFSNRVSSARPLHAMVADVSLLTAIFDNYVAEIRLDGKPVQLALWDTACVAW